LDFGVAKHRDMPHAFEAAPSSQFVGTPCYMSPEQARGLPVDARSDLWALAVIVFECLTGDVPFQQESMLDLIQAISHGPMPSITANNPELPEELEGWWRRATARDPKRRFQSAKELADSLAEAAGVYPLPVSGFPLARGDAPTLPTPFCIAVASPRAASGVEEPGNSYETDAAVTMHSPNLSSIVPLDSSVLRSGRRHVLPYVLAAGALGAVLALTLSGWRPLLEVARLGFDSGAPPLPQLKDVPPKSVQSEATLAAALPVSTLPANTPEPAVVLAEPSPAMARAIVPVSAGAKSSNAVAPKPNAWREPNAWRALAPPASPPARAVPVQPDVPPPAAEPSLEEPLEKDYGI
jgi:serine/threonine-protein kinase